MNEVVIMIQKEWKRVFSDKRLVFGLYCMPILLMAGLSLLMGQMQENRKSDVRAHIPTVYVQNPPKGFQEYVKQTRFQADIHEVRRNGIDKVKLGIQNGRIDVAIVFDIDFLNRIANYQEGASVPEVKTYYNPSEEYSSSARTGFVEKVLAPYRQALLAERIGDLDAIWVFHIDIVPESSVVMDHGKAAGKMLGMMLPYFVTMLLFSGAMSLGVDAVAGEKERGTLASMLITPVKRNRIVAGKLISLSLLSCLSAAIYAASMAAALPSMIHSLSGGGIQSLGMKFSILQILQLLVIMLALVYLYAAIVVLAAVSAKTSKEANTYISPIYMMVLAAGLITMYQKGEAGLAAYAIPIYGSAISIQSLLIGKLTTMQFFVVLSGTIGAGSILTHFITKAFNSERIMFDA